MKLKRMIAPLLAMSLIVPGAGGAKAMENPTVSTPAADLRSTFDHLLSEHYVLAVTAMTKSFDSAEDAEQAMDALDQNAADMTPAVASVYGEEGAAEFQRIFGGHNDYTADLVAAAKENDGAARDAAEKEVEEFVQEFSTFLDTATEGNLPKTAAEEAIRLHEEQVLNVFDYYAAGEYEKAYKTFREGYKHMYVISKALSGAIVAQMPEKFQHTKVDEPAAELRSTLNSLAAEHFALAAIGMQKGYDKSEDYDFVSWAEDENTAEFKEALAGIYGEEGAAQFEKVWQDGHINAQAELVSASLEGNEEGEKAAKEKLHAFSANFGSFLSAATEGNLPEEDAQAAVKAHEETVIKTFEQYSSGEFQEAYSTFREGYALMYGVGEALGNAIVTQMPEKFAGTAVPEEMPKTGMGGTSNTAGMMWAGIAAAFAIGAGFAARRKTETAE
ncbi:copper amine oxidase [Bacillus lacus]|uniref:Copper amine oxidase n=1 Tax=Metabacillus lacus TaxID=1983721 RepID=A0A7X2IY98_9BACI|nr:copper amine oxidase [Metabacillus lacus]MRX71890.1 copper amine oxidase [Metabacillus lacus]